MSNVYHVGFISQGAAEAIAQDKDPQDVVDAAMEKPALYSSFNAAYIALRGELDDDLQQDELTFVELTEEITQDGNTRCYTWSYKDTDHPYAFGQIQPVEVQ